MCLWCTRAHMLHERLRAAHCCLHACVCVRDRVRVRACVCTQEPLYSDQVVLRKYVF